MGEESALPELDGSHGLEQFVLLAKVATGAAAAQLINDATQAPGLYVFGELLEMSNIQELIGTEHEPFFRMLEIFTYGTYKDYKNSLQQLPNLSQVQITKLRHLTVLTIAAKNKKISYSILQEELDIPNVRELEDLIIEAIYQNILQAKLDQRNHQLEVECFIGRDLKGDLLESMVHKLENWCSNCSSVVNLLEREITRANELKLHKTKQKDTIENEIKSLKQAVSLSKDADSEIPDSSNSKLTSLPKKGIRGSKVK